jgi:hypothetical protein
MKRGKTDAYECCDNKRTEELAEVEAELEHACDSISDIAPVDEVEVKAYDVFNDLGKGIPEILGVINYL